MKAYLILHSELDCECNYWEVSDGIAFFNKSEAEEYARKKTKEDYGSEYKDCGYFVEEIEVK